MASKPVGIDENGLLPERARQAIADDAANPASELGASLSDTYVAAAAPTSRQWVFLGDSITNGSSATNFAASLGPATAAAAGNNIVNRGFTEAGVSGETMAQQLARLPGLMATYTPAGVHILAGTNDIGGGGSLATFQAGLIAAAKIVRAAQAQLVVGTIPPVASGFSGAAARATTVDAFNYWIRSWAPSVGGVVADYHSALIDPTTGYMASTYDSGDGIHPNTLGHAIMGDVAARAIRSLWARNPNLIVTKGGANLITNPLIGTVAAGHPSNTFDVSNSGVACTASVVADASSELTAGTWAQLAIDSTGGASTRVRAFSCAAAGADTWAVGDTILMVGTVQIEVVSGDWRALAAAATAAWEISAYNGSTGAVFCALNTGRLSGRLTSPGVYTIGPIVRAGVITSGAASIAVRYGYTTPSGPNLKFRFGQLGIINATKQGISAALDGNPVTL